MFGEDARPLAGLAAPLELTALCRETREEFNQRFKRPGRVREGEQGESKKTNLKLTGQFH